MASEKESAAPRMLDDTVIVVGEVEAALITIANALLQTCAALSFACTVKLYVCAVVGVPEIMPLVLLSVSPGGIVPEVIDHV